MAKRFDPGALMLPLLGISLVLLIWTALSLKVAPDLPSPLKTWQESQQYILNPFFKDGEMNQGILRFAFLSLIRVAKGFFLAIAIGTPLGFLLGLSPKFHQAFDPVIQVLRPISPLAWLPLGSGDFQAIGTGGAVHHRAVRHVADGDQHGDGRAQHRRRVSQRRPRAQALADEKTAEDHDSGDVAVHVYRLSFEPRHGLAGDRRCGDAHGFAGLGGFLWQEYNSLVYSHILLSVLAIGLIGFALDRLMGVVERRFKTA